MTDPVGSQDRSGDERATPPGMPRWVKVSALVAVVLVIIVIVVMVLGGGEHGPGLHTGADSQAVLITPFAMEGPRVSVW